MNREFKERVEIVLKRLDNQPQMELCRASADLLRQAMAELTTRVEPSKSPAEFALVVRRAGDACHAAFLKFGTDWRQLGQAIERLDRRYHGSKERVLTPETVADIKQALDLEYRLTGDTKIVAPLARFLGVDLDDPDVFERTGSKVG
jgi:hypothetical protein